MAQLTGPNMVTGSIGDTTKVDTSQQVALGTEMHDTNVPQGVWVYLQGVASTAIGSAVLMNKDGTTALLPQTGATCVGAVAIAGAAIGANQFGWYQVVGFASVQAGGAGGTAIRKQLFPATSATGVVSDTYQGGAQVHSMVSLTSSTAAPGNATITVYINRPWVNNLSDS